jgi:hypothetical protein
MRLPRSLLSLLIFYSIERSLCLVASARREVANPMLDEIQAVANEIQAVANSGCSSALLQQ